MQRTGFNSSDLIRLLAEGMGAEGKVPPASLAERLGQWLSWTDASALAGVLKRPTTGAGLGGLADASAAAQALATVRAELQQAILADPSWGPPRPRSSPSTAAQPLAVPDFGVFRQAYTEQQYRMALRLEPLRQQLRAQLTQAGAAQVRLAALDTVMAKVLAEHERSALAKVPLLLGRRFERLRAAQPAPALADARLAWHAGGWLRRFSQDLQAVLQAELAVRLQPAQGLVAALDNALRRPQATPLS
jgi:hypothetical protein